MTTYNYCIVTINFESLEELLEGLNEYGEEGYSLTFIREERDITGKRVVWTLLGRRKVQV